MLPNIIQFQHSSDKNYNKNNPPLKGTPVKITFPKTEDNPKTERYGFFHFDMDFRKYEDYQGEHDVKWVIAHERNYWNRQWEVLPEWCKVISVEQMIQGIVKEILGQDITVSSVEDNSFTIQLRNTTFDQLQRLSKEFNTTKINFSLEEGYSVSDSEVEITVEDYNFRRLQNKKEYF